MIRVYKQLFDENRREFNSKLDALKVCSSLKPENCTIIGEILYDFCPLCRNQQQTLRIHLKQNVMGCSKCGFVGDLVDLYIITKRTTFTNAVNELKAMHGLEDYEPYDPLEDPTWSANYKEQIKWLDRWFVVMFDNGRAEHVKQYADWSNKLENELNLGPYTTRVKNGELLNELRQFRLIVEHSDECFN